MTHTITWLDDEDVTEVLLTDTPRHYSATGYGRKIPTHYMLRITGRWHRVYMMQYANSGTAYVLKGGKELILETPTEHRIGMYEEAIYKGFHGLKFPARLPQPVRLDTLAPGDRFCFQFDGVVNTLVSCSAGPAPEGTFRSGRHTWTDYQGEHTMHAGTYALTGKPAWPYVFTTTEAQTEVAAA